MRLPTKSSPSDPQLTALKSSLGQKRSELLGTLAGLDSQQSAAQADWKSSWPTPKLRCRRCRPTCAPRQRPASKRSYTRGEPRGNRRIQAAARSAAADECIATTATPKFQRSDEIKADVERLQTRYNTIDERIGNLELESSSPGSVHLFQPARPPLGPAPSKTHKYLLMLFPMSILLGIAAAVLFDLLDPHLYTGGDVEVVMGFSPSACFLTTAK